MMRRLFHAAAWLLLLGVAAVTVSPIGFRPQTGLPADVERFLGLAFVSAMFWLGYPRHRPVVVVLILSAVVTFEVLQEVIPGRHGRIQDALVKVAGAGVGFAVVTVCSLVRASWNEAGRAGFGGYANLWTRAGGG